MAQPSVSDVHVNTPLTMISIAYAQEAADFVAQRVFPPVRVGKQSDLYYIYNKNDFMRDEMQRRAPGTESAGSGYNLSTTPYNCDVFALHKDIDQQEMANADDVLDPERDATLWLTQQALRKMERQFNTDFFTTSVWGTDATPGVLWDVYGTSNPISDVATGVRTILRNTGMKANTLVLGYDVYKALKDHPDLVDRIKYTSSDTVTPQLMARLFDLDRVLVSQAAYATNIEGETAAYAFAAGSNDALLAHVAPTPGRRVPSAGYMFVWDGISRGLGETVSIDSWYEKRIASQRVEIQMAWDNKVTGSDLGYFFSNAVT